MVLAGTILAVILALWLAAAAWIVTRLGLGFAQALLYAPFKVTYRVDDRAVAGMRSTEPPVIYVVSHQSRLEPALMLSLLPSDTLHILDQASARAMWLDPWRSLARTIAFNAKQVFVSRRLVRRLKGNGRLAVYLPDNVEPDAKAFRLYRAIARIAAKAEARIVPIVVSGTRHSLFSLASSQDAPRRLFSCFRVTKLEPLTIAELVARANGQRATNSNAFFDRLAEARFAAGDRSATLFGAFRTAAARYGAGRVIAEDALGTSLSYRRLMIGARALALRLRRTSESAESVGVMLPNSCAFVVSFLALQSAGRIVAMINYTAGPANVAAAIRTGQIKSVISSRAFVEKGQLQDIVEAVEHTGARVLWLEDLRKEVGAFDKILAWLAWRRPLAHASPEKPAVMLFTSGSEGQPKGVLLSHRNILANVDQVETRIAFSPRDRLFNALPVFHSFGLTCGTLLPLLKGVALYLYPSPLHYKLIPQTAARVKPTILLGTDTFLANYAKSAKNEDFASLRLVVAGAEAVRDETRQIWRERFGCDIHEGYGMTETSPIVAVNSATHGRPGTVGRLLPGILARLEPMEGLEDGGRLSISGPNVMLGYLTADRPGEIQAPEHGWHESGDVVSIDREGFVAIRGRAKRFAKIAGEMVSLGAIEMLAGNLWPEEQHAVVSVPDKRRGERIVLVTTADEADRNALRQFCKRSGAAEIMIPNDVVKTADIPVLGTGKTDYVGVRRLALETLGLKEAA